jgi:hypothetical protein
MFPIDPEEEAFDYIAERHRECGCQGKADPCACVDDCPICREIRSKRNAQHCPNCGSTDFERIGDREICAVCGR